MICRCRPTRRSTTAGQPSVVTSSRASITTPLLFDPGDRWEYGTNIDWVGQVVEGNYLQPKIVGNHVGLHPVWLLLALSVFGALFGFVGMMVAVPLAAALGVLVRYATERYVESPLYTGIDPNPQLPEPYLVELVPEGTLRAMRRAITQERVRLEQGLAFLASVGSAAPFIGLFGTVWGIYHALLAIGAAGQSSLDKVAGPVGEALIMTGFGLAVALPAVLIYNFFVRRNRLRLAALEEFGHDLFTLLVTGFEQVATNNVTPLVERETRQGRG